VEGGRLLPYDPLVGDSILVTGAAGFIGARFVESCARRGVPVISVDRPVSFTERVEHRGIEFGTVVDRDALERTFLERTRYMRETGTPIWVGEFGPVYTGDRERDQVRYRIAKFQLGGPAETHPITDPDA